MNGHKSFVFAYMTAMFNTGSILINRALENLFRSTREGSNIDILPSEAFLGTEHSIFRIYEPRTPLGDEFSISHFVFENPFGWSAAAVALVVMATVAFGIRASPRGLRIETSTNPMV
ncbi:mannosyl phosphorylinositol ceramide synthase SUR1 [Penicillium longicatenatum]|nr:mannosyl phosphorylinositol ceramide synthase SUR1 [Penicillium longicatenatum]